MKLRVWRGVRPVADPSGVAIRTRLRITPEGEVVLDAVATHLGELRRADLPAMCRPQPPAAGLGRRRGGGCAASGSIPAKRR